MNYSNHTTAATSGEDRGVSVDQILLVTFALLLSVFIIFVNSITIFLIHRTQGLHTLSNIYVVSLATTDLVVGVGLIPLSLFYIPSIRNQYYDKNIKFCVLILGINLGMAVVSTIHMVLVATDRYMYIIWPYIYQSMVGRKTIYVILSCTWSFGIFYSLLPQIIHNDTSTVNKCDITLALPIEYMFHANVSIYTVCVLIDVTMYSQILYAAYRQRRVIQSKTVFVEAISTNNYDTIAVTQSSQQERVKPREWKVLSMFQQDHSEAQASQTNIIRKNSSPGPRKKTSSRMKSVKFFMTVFGVYFICLTPTVVCMGVDYYLTLPRFLYNMFNLLALLNSGMNFIIYFVLNSRFRIAVLRLFRYSGVANFVEATDGSYLDG